MQTVQDGISNDCTDPTVSTCALRMFDFLESCASRVTVVGGVDLGQELGFMFVAAALGEHFESITCLPLCSNIVTSTASVLALDTTEAPTSP